MWFRRQLLQHCDAAVHVRIQSVIGREILLDNVVLRSGDDLRAHVLLDFLQRYTKEFVKIIEVIMLEAEPDPHVVRHRLALEGQLFNGMCGFPVGEPERGRELVKLGLAHPCIVTHEILANAPELLTCDFHHMDGIIKGVFSIMS